MNQELVSAVRDRVEDMFTGEGSGHDWWHIYRVWQNSKLIAKFEDCNLLLVEISALVHDVGDHKFLKEGETQEQLIRELLEELNLKNEIITQVQRIVSQVSYKGAGVPTVPDSLEAKVVQDADRLDAIGAIGVARAFAFGGSRDRLMYDPNVPPQLHDSFEDYKKDEGHTINHFYEKLLLLKERFQTDKGKELASGRHQYLKGFIDQFLNEWEGKC